MNIVFVGLNGVPNRKRAADARLGAFIQLLSESHEVTVMGASPLDAVRILRMKHVDMLHVYCGHYLQILFYWLLSRIIGARVVYQYVEYRSAFHWDNGRKKKWLIKQYQRLNGYLCDHYGARLWDGCIAISDCLRDRALEVNPRLKVLKVTPLCDIQQFEQNTLSNPVGRPYIFYCGNQEYLDVAETIQKAYDQSILKNKMKLIMHISGQLDYGQLVAYYKHAEALLIPLRNEVADIARFPNKVCEYCAAHGVIITTPYGEMKRYFRDGENAIVATGYSVEALKEKMDALADGKYDTTKLSRNAYETGRKYFDVISYTIPLNEFLNGMVNCKL